MGFFGKNKTPNADKTSVEKLEMLTGRDGDPIFLENYNDEFIDSCDFLPYQKDCFFCEADSPRTCEQHLHKLYRKHNVNVNLLHHHPEHKHLSTKCHHFHTHHVSNEHDKHHKHNHHHHHNNHHHNDHDHDHHRHQSDDTLVPVKTGWADGCLSGCGARQKRSNFHVAINSVIINIGAAIWKNDWVSKIRQNIDRKTAAHGEEGRGYTQQDNDEFVTSMVRAHNLRREEHGVEPLQLSLRLCERAQDYADVLAELGTLKHSNKIVAKHRHLAEDMPCGENIAYSEAKEGRANMTGENVTSLWYHTNRHYNFSKQEDTERKAGCFTQVVWRSSKEIGIARVTVSSRTLAYCVRNLTRSKQEKNYVVALYYPRGNVEGYYCQNVYKHQ